MHIWKNSNYVNTGDIFLVDDSNEMYVTDAIKKGASKIITETDNTYCIETVKVDSINDYIKSYYDFNNIKLIGVTGTNGKTTTCYLIYQMLNYIGVKTAYIGTIGFYLNDNVKVLDNTTPDIDLLYNLINKAKESKCKVVVMEVSSHALKQNRVYDLLFDAIIVTNITRDHLDYHKTKKDYIKSKQKIVKMLKNKKICILNKKDKYYKKFKNKNNSNYIIGKDIKIKKIENYLDKTEIIIKEKKKKKITLSLIGSFNVYNFLMAYKTIKELGFNYHIVLNNAAIFNEPTGRMQKINYKLNVIFIDYAHTPDAILKVLKTVKKIKSKGIITVVGAGGNRDKEKRSIMGKYSCKYSKYVIFTNDNPRHEDPKRIIDDITSKARRNYEIIYDRYEAIKKGIELLKENMILLVLGKGHEDYQIIGDEKSYFSDIETVKNIIK